jgi:hypothetical protein
MALTIVQIVWAGVFQYCVIRVAMTIVAVVTQAFGLYCEASLSPAFAHIWVCYDVAIDVLFLLLIYRSNDRLLSSNRSLSPLRCTA